MRKLIALLGALLLVCSVGVTVAVAAGAKHHDQHRHHVTKHKNRVKKAHKKRHKQALKGDPVAVFTYAPSSPVAGQVVTFDASGSTCSPTPCTYSWKDVGPSGTADYPLGTGEMLNFTFQNVGTKYVVLTVKDALGDIATVKHDVVVGSSQSPQPVAAFTFSPSSPAAGQQVTFTATSCNGCSYSWRDVTSSGTGNYPLGTGNPLTFTFQGAGTKYVQLTVTAGGKTATVEENVVVSSTPPTPAVAPSNTALPSISGTPQQGDTLTASTGTWSGTAPISYTYLWSDGTTGSTDTLPASDVGKSVSVTVQATNSAGSVKATSASVGPVTSPDPASPTPPSNTSPPTISGSPQQGDTLTASDGMWSGTAPITYTYAWSDGTTGSTDTLPASDVGQDVSVTVTATNSAGSSSATSTAVGPVAASSGPPPPPPSGTPIWHAQTLSDSYPWTEQCPGDMSDVADPLGSGQTVIEFNVPDTCGLDSGNPAAGTESPSLFTPGTNLYATMSYYIPTSSEPNTGGRWFQLDEIYGAPYGNTPVSPATGVEPVNGVDHIAEYWNGSTSVSGVPCPEYCPTWVGPELDGRWHQVTVHVVINSDGSGSTQVYFDGVLQTLANGSTTDSYQVLQSGNNWNGGSSGDYIISDEYYSSSEPSPGPIYHGYQAIGSTLASVEPPTGWGTP